MTNSPRGQHRLALSAITLAVLTLTNQALAQQAEAPMVRIEVTGSSIKRLASEDALPVTIIKADELEKRGMTTLADVMMALPQSASLAPSNAGSGTNINLRGLGVNRTLVLLNGRRLANEAIADGYANLYVIPISALARVEVLNDGASSIYGSDAIGGVVNFITKPTFTGLSITGQKVQPERHGGAIELRSSATLGYGNLETDGWNMYATIDAHRRSRLLASDRAYLTNAALLTSIGRAPTLASGGYATPANFTTAANKSAANPYYASACLAPYSIQGAKNTCVIDANEYGTALYGNERVTFYTKASKKLGADHLLTLEYSRGETKIFGTKNPTTSLPANGATAQLPSTSPWYPGKSGGVPAVAGLNNAPLLVTWSVADLGAATTRDVQLNQRLALNAEGKFASWDYKAGLVHGDSDRKGYYESGYVNGAQLLAGIANGALNPFGLQDAAGKTYLHSISVDGANNRFSKSTFAGVDLTVTHPLMTMAGGDMIMALGTDFHRDTNADTKTDITAQVTYANSVPAHGEGARNVAALFGELDMPVTKQLNVNLAARGDKFSDFGSTFNPKASFRYQPSKTLMFRGSASSGFRAPTLFDRYGYRTAGANGSTAGKWDDPVLCPGGTPGVAGTGKALPGYVSGTVCNAAQFRQTGSNPEVTPETSRSQTLGVVFEPSSNSSISFDFWNIAMKNMLANLPEQVYFTNYAKYSNLFVRNADGSLAYIKNIVMNLGEQKASGIDVSAAYAFPRTSAGTFKFNLDGTYLTRFDNQLEKDSPFASNIGQFGLASNGTTASQPVITFRWKHTARISWSNGNWGAQLTQNHNSGYTDQNLVAADYARNIDQYSVWNMTTSYSGIPHVVVVLGVTNLRDANPPVTNHSGYNGYLSSAASPVGRAFNARLTYNY